MNGYDYLFRVFLIALLSTFVMFMAFVLTASSVHADDGADDGVNDMWTYGNYGTSELLKMPQAYVLRDEHGYVVLPIVRMVSYHIDGIKVIGEGEEVTQLQDQWIVRKVQQELWEQDNLECNMQGNWRVCSPKRDPKPDPEWDWGLIPQPNELGIVNNI